MTELSSPPARGFVRLMRNWIEMQQDLTKHSADMEPSSVTFGGRANKKLTRHGGSSAPISENRKRW